MIFAFLKDFVNKGALKSSKGLVFTDIWALLLLGLSNVSAFYTYLKKILVEALGVPFIIIPLLIFTMGITWCFYLISAKSKIKNLEDDLNVESNHTVIEYKYNYIIRIIAKVIFLFMIYFFPFFLLKTIKDVIPLPPTIAGIIFELGTGEPIQKARLKLIDRKGREISILNREFITDSKGIYYISSNKRIPKDSKLMIIKEGCGSTLVELSRVYETDPNLFFSQFSNKKFPFFKHELMLCKK